MNFKVMIEKAGLILRQASPEILLGSGIVLGVAAIITACSKMSETDDVKVELQEELNYIEETEEKGTKEYISANFKAGVRAFLRYIAIFWIPIVLEIMSILAIWYSHGLMVKRNADLASAVVVIAQQMDKYRSRVRDKVGVEAENDLYFGLTKSPTGETVVITDENGKDKKVKHYDILVTDGAEGPFDRIFDRTNPNWSSSPSSNLFYVQAVLNECKDKLIYRSSKSSDGWLTLNEVYDKLGFESTESGFNWGWTFSRRDPNESCVPDIDFGISNYSTKTVKNYINGRETVIPLHFNCKPINFKSLNLLEA